MDVPQVPVNFVPANAGETFMLGPVQIRIMEDGSRTDNRIGSAEFTLPANTPGPIAHWHEMVGEDSTVPISVRHLLTTKCNQHDETFLVTQGTVRFHCLDGKSIDAQEGDYVTVPTRAVHTFSNPTDKPAKFFNTYTPAFYINYFKMLAQLVEAGKPMTAEANRRAMAYFATIGVADEVMRSPEEREQMAKET